MLSLVRRLPYLVRKDIKPQWNWYEPYSIPVIICVIRDWKFLQHGLRSPTGYSLYLIHSFLYCSCWSSALTAVDDIPVTNRYLDIVFSLYSLSKGCSNCTGLLGQDTQEKIGIAADSRIAGRCSILEQEKASIMPKPERVCHSFGDRMKASPSNCLPYKLV